MSINSDTGRVHTLFYGFGFGHGYPYRPFMHNFSANYHNWSPGSHYLEGRNFTNGTYRGPRQSATADTTPAQYWPVDSMAWEEAEAGGASTVV
ncbi:MAG: hypothetical protein WBQ43_17300 [Terriglobales bacterium]